MVGKAALKVKYCVSRKGSTSPFAAAFAISSFTLRLRCALYCAELYWAVLGCTGLCATSKLQRVNGGVKQVGIACVVRSNKKRATMLKLKY